MKENSDEFTFTACGPVYTLCEGATKDDLLNQMSARLSQLEAMLLLISGVGNKSFSELFQKDQSNYLWACWTMTLECRELFDAASKADDA